VLSWTHRGQPIYLVPQDVDLTPRILTSGIWELPVEQVMLRFARAGDTVSSAPTRFSTAAGRRSALVIVILPGRDAGGLQQEAG
jgi:hypothetical protein